MNTIITRIIVGAMALASTAALAAEFHVATSGNDANGGTKDAPLRTIQRAADLAQPGDVVTVHEGDYRERINPPRGGASDRKRIVYQAAPGEKVEIFNVNNGARLETYVIAGKAGSGYICLNGPAARLGYVGDKLIIVSYALVTPEEAKAMKTRTVYLNDDNTVKA